MICFPNAKINLGLYITGKRDDGYHNLESLFYPVPWCDALEIIPGDIFSFSVSGISIPDNDNNLVIKAWQLLEKDFALPPVRIHLHKNIPIGAGLGGGSSDAAFTLKLLNKIFRLDLDIPRLEDYARRLGSDCAFFIRNSPMLALEKGDRFENISISLEGKFLAMVYPGIHISTAEAYQGIVPEIPRADIRQTLKKNISDWQGLLENSFEKHLFEKYPELSSIRNKLLSMGAEYASMSGSGSTIFGIFSGEQDLKGVFRSSFKIREVKI